MTHHSQAANPCSSSSSASNSSLQKVSNATVSGAAGQVGSRHWYGVTPPPRFGSLLRSISFALCDRDDAQQVP